MIMERLSDLQPGGNLMSWPVLAQTPKYLVHHLCKYQDATLEIGQEMRWVAVMIMERLSDLHLGVIGKLVSKLVLVQTPSTRYSSIFTL